MSRPMANVISHAVRGVVRRCQKARNTIEWHSEHALGRQGPWLRNRWGQRYRAISLSEYHYLRDGNPETYESALIERLLRPGMMVVDVGANHGMFSLEAAHLIGGAGIIHAFEPAPATRALLVSNLEANAITTVRTFPCAP